MLFFMPSRGTRIPQKSLKRPFEEIERLQDELVSEEELAKIHNRARASFLYTLASDTGLAEVMAIYELSRRVGEFIGLSRNDPVDYR